MNIGVLCSGSGTNLQAIIDSVKKGSIKATVAVVISDNKDAFALVRAKASGIETLVLDPKDFNSRESFD
ncbi:MAG: formyltransferase family protein, partial [Candidatus Omnitrophota bacterium]